MKENSLAALAAEGEKRKTMEMKGMEAMKKETAEGMMQVVEVPEGTEMNQVAKVSEGIEMNQVVEVPEEAEVNQAVEVMKEAEVDQAVEVMKEAEVDQTVPAWKEAGMDSEERQKELAKQIRHQMRVIRQGAADLIGEEELEQKVRDSILTGKPLTIKFGMDPSAPDIHVGHAVPLRKLKQMQDLGHNIVVVIGDFTGKIGDPTGRSKGRKALTEGEVFRNAQTYQEQIFRILDKDKTQVRYNGEWLELLSLSDALELASTITVARMMERDDFQSRFRAGTPIGLHEFFYPLLQAYDSVELEADLELGGTDQTFNILMGRSLQKEKGQEPQAALFMPLLEGIDGTEKMSKSLGNYIGICEDARTMYTKVMQVPDHLIIKYFELTTDIQPEELDKIKEQLADGRNPRDYKMVLARTVTLLYHSAEETEEAEKFFKEAFTNKAVPEQVDTLDVVLESGTLFDCIHPLISAGIVKSGGEFRRLIAQGGVQKNGVRVEALEENAQTGDVLKVGKRKFVRIEMC